MDVCIKILTHESIVHTQMNSIEKILGRQVDFDLTLNKHGIKSNILFTASVDELRRVKDDLGYRIYVKKDENWILDI